MQSLDCASAWTQSWWAALHQGEVSQRSYWSQEQACRPPTMGDHRAQLLAPPDGGGQPATLPEQRPYLSVELSHQAHPNVGSPHYLRAQTLTPEPEGLRARQPTHGHYQLIPPGPQAGVPGKCLSLTKWAYKVWKKRLLTPMCRYQHRDYKESGKCDPSNGNSKSSSNWPKEMECSELRENSE